MQIRQRQVMGLQMQARDRFERALLAFLQQRGAVDDALGAAWLRTTIDLALSLGFVLELDAARFALLAAHLDRLPASVRQGEHGAVWAVLRDDELEPEVRLNRALAALVARGHGAAAPGQPDRQPGPPSSHDIWMSLTSTN